MVNILGNERLALRFFVKYHDIENFSFPIYIEFLNKNIYINDYDSSEQSIREIGGENIREKDIAFSASVLDNEYAIYFKSGLSKMEMVEAIAHEMGHILLGHPLVIDLSGEARHVDDLQKAKNEEEAKIFADTYMARYRDKLDLLKVVKKDEEKLKQSLILPLKASIMLMAVTMFLIIYLYDNLPFSSEKPLPAIVISSETPTHEPTIAPTISDFDSIPNPEGAVFVTSAGNKFHLDNCRYVKNKTNITEMTIEKAMQDGYGACDVCQPLD